MKLPGISYVSPLLRFDSEARVLVIQYRDTDTGEVSRQIPSEEALRDIREDMAGQGERFPPASAERAIKAEERVSPEGAPSRVSLTV